MRHSEVFFCHGINTRDMIQTQEAIIYGKNHLSTENILLGPTSNRGLFVGSQHWKAYEVKTLGFLPALFLFLIQGGLWR